MRAISVRPAALRRNSTSLTSISNFAAGSYAVAAWAAGSDAPAAAPAAAISLTTSRRSKVSLVIGRLPSNDLVGAMIAESGAGRSRPATAKKPSCHSGARRRREPGIPEAHDPDAAGFRARRFAASRNDPGKALIRALDDLVEQLGLAAPQALEVLLHDGEHVVLVAARLARGVRRDQHVVHRPQRGIGRQRLLHGHV